MLRRLASSDSRFKNISFNRGMNIILADRDPESTGTDSRNGAGKSSLIEIVHFLLGMRSLRGSVLENPELGDHAFTLLMDREVRGEGVVVTTVTRSLARRSRVFVSPDPFDGAALVSHGRELTVPEWVKVLGDSQFRLPADDEDAPSARSLLSLYLRRVSQHGFDDPVKTYPTQSATDAATGVAYLLGLDWRISASYQKLASRESIRRKLKQAINDPDFRVIVGSTSELRGLVAAAVRRVTELESEAASFRVVPEYEEIQRRADEVDASIRRLRARDSADRRNMRDLEDAIRDESDPEVAYLERVYGELGVELPGHILRRYDEVAEFHASVISNRRAYLREEIETTRARLAERAAERDRLGGEHARLLSLLNDGGALSSFTALQEQLSYARSERATLQSRLDTARQFEASQAEIQFERSRLQQEAMRDLGEREGRIQEINGLFQQFAESLYGPEREAYIDIAATGTGVRIAPHIAGEDSEGIRKMVIFCFDLTLAVFAKRSGRGPDFLMHDSHIFDGVDERQAAEALLVARHVCENEGLQYIVTLNSDDLEKFSRVDDSIAGSVIEPRLTDAIESGGLFGFRFG